MTVVSPSPNSQRVLEARYLLRDSGGRILEDFEGLCDRVAGAVAGAEREFGGDEPAVAEAFATALARREFLPNSPTLMNAGTPIGQLAACFVLPVEDSLESIFESVKRMAVIHQSGGGTGFSFSHLRPKGDEVQGSRGVASGPVSFLEVFDAATAVIVQGGRRRGANMGILRVDHPDVFDFVRVKASPDRITNFNLSVATTDAFWRAADAGESFDLVNPRDGKVVRTVDAGELLDEIAENAWGGGDPGVIFLDAVNRDNPTPSLGALAATNPCGELPLHPNESCNLASLRLDAFVGTFDGRRLQGRGAAAQWSQRQRSAGVEVGPLADFAPSSSAAERSMGRIDWERLDAAIDLVVRFLDDVIEIGDFPYPEIRDVTRANRKIGLGVMGYADLLVDLGLAYDSPEAVVVADRLMAHIRLRAEHASSRLAEERGVFPNFRGSRAEARGLRLRNATVTSIAPTGSLSILANCSAGIEPYFALASVRHVLDGERMLEANLRLESALRRANAWSPDLVAEIRETGSVRGVASAPAEVRRLFPTASDISAESHLDIQEAFQRRVDNAVSKTINLPEGATAAEIRQIYTSAWRRGLKGVTVFREGCKPAAIERGRPCP